MPKYSYTGTVVNVTTGAKNSVHGEVIADSRAEAIALIDAKFREVGVRSTALAMRAS